MNQGLWIALITAIGGSGGLYAIIHAILDYRNGKLSRESDADERFNVRLDKRVEDEGRRAELLQARLDAEREYTHRLTLALVQSGHQVPPREYGAPSAPSGL